MTAPFFEYGLFGPGASLLVAIGIGIVFGWTLERAGLGSARKLVGQFYLTDFTVFKVMFTAILTAMLGAFWLGAFGVLDLSRVYVPETYVWPQLVGGLVFGVGFVVGGLCPGTSCVAAASGRGDGLMVVAGMFVGVMLTGLVYPLIEGFASSSPMGAWTVPDLVGLPYGVVVAGVVGFALLAFRVLERLERRT